MLNHHLVSIKAMNIVGLIIQQEQIEGVRAVDAGPLRFSRFVEGITVLLIGINGRYKTQTHVKVSGIPAPPPHE